MRKNGQNNDHLMIVIPLREEHGKLDKRELFQKEMATNSDEELR